MIGYFSTILRFSTSSAAPFVIVHFMILICLHVQITNQQQHGLLVARRYRVNGLLGHERQSSVVVCDPRLNNPQYCQRFKKVDGGVIFHPSPIFFLKRCVFVVDLVGA